LCYASKTSCRLNSEEMPFLPHRAITAVVIHNEGSDSFLLQSVKLPVNYLSLYQSESDDLWTETVSLYRYDGDKLSRLHISKKPISSIPIKKKISGPRIKSEKNIVVKAFNAFFDKENR